MTLLCCNSAAPGLVEETLKPQLTAGWLISWPGRVASSSRGNAWLAWAKVRNPKPEVRKKSETRSPKERDEHSTGMGHRGHFGFRTSELFRISDFGPSEFAGPECANRA